MILLRKIQLLRLLTVTFLALNYIFNQPSGEITCRSACPCLFKLFSLIKGSSLPGPLIVVMLVFGLRMDLTHLEDDATP